MSNKYLKELEFTKNTVSEAYAKIFAAAEKTKIEKAAFDVVTPVDIEIESYILKCIKESFPEDRILSEEELSGTEIEGRTWTVDPIDGTFNMANDSPLFGIQCSLFDRGEVVMAVIYLPKFSEMYYAALGMGAYLNGERIYVRPTDFDKSAVSFGDFPHTNTEDSAAEARLMGRLKERIAKIRMFGSAAMDFSFMASGKTHGTVIFTKNKWDIAPGILIAKEAGAVLRTLGGEYTWDSAAVVAAASEELYSLICDCM